jgi:hypothetical protein
MLVKRLLSALFFSGVLLVLGAAAFMAMPRGDDVLAEVDPLLQAGAAAQLDNQAVTAAKYNAIAMSLDATDTISNAQALANSIVGSQTILRWNPTTQGFEFWIPSPGIGTNFSTTIGTPYFVQVDNSNPGTFTLVGDVPPQSGQSGAVQFDLLGGSPCKYNFITLPLDYGDTVTNAAQLAAEIGGVETLLRWNASTQGFEFYVVGPAIGTNFSVSAGYPYWVCMTSSQTWPTTAP